MKVDELIDELIKFRETNEDCPVYFYDWSDDIYGEVKFAVKDEIEEPRFLLQINEGPTNE